VTAATAQARTDSAFEGADLASAFPRLQAMVADDLARADALIRERMASKHAPLIPTLAAHLIEAGGKRLRPILTIAGAQLCGYRGDAHVKLAAAVEFIHSATLLHDDVVDESDLRRGRKTANFRWGNKNSILVGDYVFARSFQLMVETGSIEALRILSDASAVIAEGEVLQLAMQNDLSTGEDTYFQVIRGKTAALFSAAAEVGAVIAGENAEKQAALRDYGDRLGIAFQIADDLLDYGGSSAALGKNVGDDFREGKITLPVLIAYARSAGDDKAFWKRVIEKRDQKEGDLDRALALLASTGALAETRVHAERHALAARDALDVFPPSALRDTLRDLVAFVVARTS